MCKFGPESSRRTPLETYEDDIGWSTGVRANTPQVLPVRSKGGNPHLHGILVVKTTHECDVVLHGGGEAGALERSATDTLDEHWGQADDVGLSVDALLEDADHLAGDLEQGVSICNGDVVNHVPGILLMVSRCHTSPSRTPLTFSKVLTRDSNGRWGESLEYGDLIPSARAPYVTQTDCQKPTRWGDSTFLTNITNSSPLMKPWKPEQ